MSERSDTDSPHYDRNPSPPPEVQQNEDLLSADHVKNTSFSSRWLFSTLRKLIEEVEREEAEEDCGFGLDVDEELQDELCKLWDMSMNVNVARFLQEYQATDILLGIITRSKAPRVVEISVGILGNMACDNEVCKIMSENTKLLQLVLLLLDNRDPPTLVETTRLIYTSLSNSSSRGSWIQEIQKSESVLENIIFIFNSSTNDDLLRNTAEVVDVLLDQLEDLCEKWATTELLQAQLEALKQIGCSHSETLEIFFHIFQLFSTTEKGVDMLIKCSEQLELPLVKYLSLLAEDEIVGLEGREACLASALSVLHILFLSDEQINKKLTKDEKLMRIFIKILEPLYPWLKSLENKAEVKPSSDLAVCSSSTSSDPAVCSSNTSDVITDKNSAIDTVTASANNGQSVSLTEESPIASGSSLDKHTPGDSLTVPVSESNHSSQKNRDSDKETQQHLSLLLTIVRGFVVDLVLSTLDGEEACLLKVVEYLDECCSRQRLKYLILTLQSVTETSVDICQCLSEAAQTHKRNRLVKIISDVLSGKYLYREDSQLSQDSEVHPQSDTSLIS